MSELMIKMAQQAHENEELLASLIAQQCARQGITWEKFAETLQIDQTQLARLALCHKPRNDSLAHDLGQIATYVGMERENLLRFARKAGYPVRLPPQAAPRKRPLLPAFLGNLLKQRTIVVGLVTVTLFALVAFAFAQPTGPEATLVVSAGEAVVSQNKTTMLVISHKNEVQLTSGNTLAVRGGDVISLPADALAQLRLQDGSTVDLSGGTVLEISELLTKGDPFQVQLNMLAGRTVNRVVRLLGVNDRYNVRTPSSTASVRGTVFTVEVLSATSSYYAVEKGVVEVRMGDQMIELLAGFEVVAELGQPLIIYPLGESPNYPTQSPAMAPSAAEQTEMVTICHYPPGNPGNPQTIQVYPDDVAAHLAHGDSLGPCDDAPTPTPITETPTGEPGKVILCHVPPGNPGKPQTIEVAADAVAAHLAHGDYLGPCLTPTATFTWTPIPSATNTPIPPPATDTPVPPPATDTPVPPPATDTPVPPPATDTPVPPPTMITICHYPPGNPGNAQTIQIPESDWPAHQAHGDTLGPCP